MKKILDDIAKLLPEGISDTGIEEISSLIEGVVNERVEAEVSNLTAKVSGYLRLKIDEVKASALKELENDDETFRAVRVYESLKSIVSEDIESKDSDSAVSFFKDENEKLQESVDSLNKTVSQLMNENTTLEDVVVTLREDVTALHETKKQPFKSSEKALVITNEHSSDTKAMAEATPNIFLTEDVIRLSQQK